jgi:hypothetical protein
VKPRIAFVLAAFVATGVGAHHTNERVASRQLPTVEESDKHPELAFVLPHKMNEEIQKKLPFELRLILGGLIR